MEFEITVYNVMQYLAEEYAKVTIQPSKIAGCKTYSVDVVVHFGYEGMTFKQLEQSHEDILAALVLCCKRHQAADKVNS